MKGILGMKGRNGMAWGILILVGMVATGCPKKAPQATVEPAPPAAAAPAEPPAGEVEVPPTAMIQPEEPAMPKEGISEGDIPTGMEDIFFDFDQSVIRDDARSILDRNARYLQDHPAPAITIEGHADERGTSEYNLALAERRAQAVRRYLEALGIDSGRLQVVSYGEEKPFCTEIGEACWSRNRRAHFTRTE